VPRNLGRHVHPVGQILAVGLCGHLQQLLDLGLELCTNPACMTVAQRTVPARVGRYSD
jgi:hypothetical protein